MFRASAVIRAILMLTAVLAGGLSARVLRGHIPDSERVWRPLGTRWAPVGVGLLCAALLAWMAGTLHRRPDMLDEWMYASQATLFAHFRWTGGSLPALFEHVVFVNSLASKYPPGESLLLTPGVWVGAPSLMPLVLSGVTAALLFATVRRIADSRIATLTVLYWLALASTLRWHVTYMSEVTSGTAWALAWWLLLVWWRDRRAVALVGVGLAIGVAMISRPLSGVALCVPIAVVVLALTARRGAWPTLGIALLAGCAVLAVIPVWSANTTGSWRVTPTEAYRRDYIPFDRLGFGLDSTPPRRGLPPELDRAMQSYRDGHREYTLAAVPRTLAERLEWIARDVWPGARRGLIPFALASLVVLTSEGWLGLACTAALVGLYLLYWHAPNYTIYYQEAEPVLCFMTVLGGVRVVERIAGPAGRRHVSLVLAVFGLAGVVAVFHAAADARRAARVPPYYERFDAMVAGIPAPKAIVFIRYSPVHNGLAWLARNEPDLAAARVWLVNDMGPDDDRIRGYAPDRTAYLFDEATWTLTPLRPL